MSRDDDEAELSAGHSSILVIIGFLLAAGFASFVLCQLLGVACDVLELL